jgi:hypothetical protein
VASTREGQVYITNQRESGWTSSLITIPNSNEREFVTVVPLPELPFFLVARQQSVDFVDARLQRAIHSFKTDPIQPKSLKCFHSRPRLMQCGATGVATLTFAYINAYTQDLVIHKYTPQDTGEAICFNDPARPKTKVCRRWKEAKETRRVIKNPGVWEASSSGVLVGVRQRQRNVGSSKISSAQTQQGLRRRHRRGSLASPPSSHTEQDDWEAWMFSISDKHELWKTVPLCSDVEDDGHLFATKLGPMVRVGRASVVVGLSNVIKVILIGNERFDAAAENGRLGGGMPTVSSRRRKGPANARSKAAIVL